MMGQQWRSKGKATRPRKNFYGCQAIEIVGNKWGWVGHILKKHDTYIARQALEREW